MKIRYHLKDRRIVAKLFCGRDAARLTFRVGQRYPKELRTVISAFSTFEEDGCSVWEDIGIQEGKTFLPQYKYLYAKGATCHPDDTFDEEKGKMLAKARLLSEVNLRRHQYYSAVSESLYTLLREIGKLENESFRKCYQAMQDERTILDSLKGTEE